MSATPEAQGLLVSVPGLKIGRLRARYKRFFADIETGALDTAETITAHCPNGGKILGLLDPGTPALYADVDSPTAKLRYRLEALRQGDTWAGVNTQRPNRLIPLAIAAGAIPELSGYTTIRPEVKYGVNSRIDLLATGHDSHPDTYIEIKNCHMSRTPGLAEFPDCEAARSTKHMYELIEMVKAGFRAVVVVCVQRNDVDRFDAARDCDPDFGRAYDAARAAGVEIIAVSFEISQDGWRFDKALEVV
ncbi:DNA/RNA nuclease SfsA [Asticcacaulis solisilvae]|uniref:DNA/RNA nuclease SfsA n=1 Tax=Asticcacaulis solisilvae TaxID=1217274 RepID=UPI003FD852CA